MIDLRNEVVDILAKMKFFQGQRAGRELWNDKPFEVQEQDLESFNKGIKTIRKYILQLEEQQKVSEWIPFKLREADEEEKEAYGLMEMLCGELPEDGEEILFTYDNGYVGIDTFIWDGCECYLDSNREFCTEAIAWQPLPAPYDMRKKVEE